MAHMSMMSQMRRNRQKRRAASKGVRRPRQAGGGVRAEHYEPGPKLDQERVRMTDAQAALGVTRRQRIPETTA